MNLNFIFSENQIKNYNLVTSFQERPINKKQLRDKINYGHLVLSSNLNPNPNPNQSRSEIP